MGWRFAGADSHRAGRDPAFAVAVVEIRCPPVPGPCARRTSRSRPRTVSTVEKWGEYLGVVSGEAIIGANVLSDIAAGIRDVIGGRSGSYEKIETGREETDTDFEAVAAERVADAVVGATFDSEEPGEGMLRVTSPARGPDPPGVTPASGLSRRRG